MVMLIPRKGFEIKICLQDIRDEDIKIDLRCRYPNSIYKGKYSSIMDNIDNKIFK